MRRLVMYILMILLSSATVYAAGVTVTIDTGSSSYSSSGADETDLDKWQIWVRSTTFEYISDENIIRNDTDASGNASFDLAEGEYYVGAVYFDKSGDFYVPVYMGISTNAAGDGLNILKVPGNTTAEINNFSKSGAVRGYVRDADGTGINGVKVTVVGYDLIPPVTTRTFDGKDGYYSIFLSPGTYTLEVRKSGYYTEQSDVTVTQGYGSTDSEFVNFILTRSVTKDFTANVSEDVDDFEDLGISLDITTKSDLTATINLTVTDDADDLGARAYSFGNDEVIGNYFEIDVSDNINSTSGNLANVTLTMSYSDADLQGADEDTLKLYWYSGSEWKPLVKGRDYGPAGPKVLDAGQDTSEKIVWVTLDHFSIFVLVGTVLPPPEDTGGGGGGGCDHGLKIADITLLDDAVPGEDVQFQVNIENTGTCAETGVKTSITDLPAGWTGEDVTTDVGYGKTVSVNIPVSIPEDTAPGTVTLTFRVTPQDYFIASLEKQISFDVGEAQPEEEEVIPAPTEEGEEEGIETVAPPEIETPTPAPPAETQPPEEEPAKAPGEEKGGICGPTVVVLLAMAALVFARRGSRVWK